MFGLKEGGKCNEQAKDQKDHYFGHGQAKDQSLPVRC
jgi:hypothetical protein